MASQTRSIHPVIDGRGPPSVGALRGLLSHTWHSGENSLLGREGSPSKVCKEAPQIGHSLTRRVSRHSFRG